MPKAWQLNRQAAAFFSPQIASLRIGRLDLLLETMSHPEARICGVPVDYGQ